MELPGQSAMHDGAASALPGRIRQHVVEEHALPKSSMPMVVTRKIDSTSASSRQGRPAATARSSIRASRLVPRQSDFGCHKIILLVIFAGRPSHRPRIDYFPG